MKRSVPQTTVTKVALVTTGDRDEAPNRANGERQST